MTIRRLVVGALLALLTLQIFVGLAQVPFHPDETSLLFQSRDVELLFSDPSQLPYSPGEPLDLAAEYRALNAPLPKYFLGAGRLAAGFSAGTVDVDWRWDMTWHENLDRGALPPQGALMGGRLASSVALAVAVLVIYYLGTKLAGWPAGLIAALLLGLNALALLHGRRAMAEGVLILTTVTAILAFMDAPDRPWLAGLAAAAAVGSKHSLLPLALLGFAVAIGLFHQQSRLNWRGGGLFAASAAGAFWLFNPFLWRAPIRGLLKIVQLRGGLLQRQVEFTDSLAPQGSLNQVGERAAAMIGHLFVLPPQLQEVGNYNSALRPSFDAYLANPVHSLLRGLGPGGVMLGLLLFGLVTGALVTHRRGGRYARRIWILAAATLLQGLALLLANPLPIQRYYVPLVPLIVLWQALALVGLGRAVKRAATGGDSELATRLRRWLPPRSGPGSE